jgi:hypothetical protein
MRSTTLAISSLCTLALLACTATARAAGDDAKDPPQTECRKSLATWREAHQEPDAVPPLELQCRPDGRWGDDWAGQACSVSAPVPYGYRCGRSRAFGGLLASGATVAALGDAFVVLTMVANKGADPYAFVPIVGPFVGAALHRPPPPPPSGPGVNFNFNFDFSALGYLFAGTAQTVGGLLMVSSLAARKTRLVRKDVPTLVPVPMLTPMGPGLGLVGTF